MDDAAEESYDDDKMPSVSPDDRRDGPNDHKKQSLREVQPLGVERDQQREEVVLVHLRGPLPVEALATDDLLDHGLDVWRFSNSTAQRRERLPGRLQVGDHFLRRE